MNVDQPFSTFQEVPIPAGGTDVGFVGSTFTCTDSTYPFQLSTNGSNWIRMERGLGIRMPVGTHFSRLFFKPFSDAQAGQTVSFYYGTIEIVDTRFNVISDAPLISVINRTSGDFFIVPSISGNLGINSTKDYLGYYTDISATNRRTRSLCVQHFTAGKYLTLQYNDPVGGFTPISRIPANQPCEFIQGCNVGVPGFAIPQPINFRIANLSGVAIDCDIYQTVWNS